MSIAWNNEKQLTFTEVSVPSLFMPSSGVKIFLAGSIDQPEDNHWRKRAIDFMRDSWFNAKENNTSITVYSPRRDDNTWLPEYENEQATWDMSMLAMVDYIVLHLTGDTISPVSLLELGMFAGDPRLRLSVDDSYSRKQIVELYYTYYGNMVYSSWLDSITEISRPFLIKGD